MFALHTSKIGRCVPPRAKGPSDIFFNFGSPLACVLDLHLQSSLDCPYSSSTFCRRHICEMSKTPRQLLDLLA